MIEHKDGRISRGWYREDPIYGVITIVNTRTKEEDEKHYKLYGNSKPLDNDFFNKTEKEYLKRTFKKKFVAVLDQIDKNWTPYWITVNTGIDRTTIIKLVSGEHLPSFQTFLRLYKWISNYIENFNIWYLVSNDEELQIKT